jgi:DNA-binding NarL/FixJ family response regulator
VTEVGRVSDGVVDDAVITVVLADDQTLLRAGLRALLDAEHDITVVAEADDGVDAIDIVRRHRPDVVVMDVRMPRLDGLAATRAIVSDPELDETRVVVLTTFDLDEYVFEALRSGACSRTPNRATWCAPCAAQRPATR